MLLIQDSIRLIKVAPFASSSLWITLMLITTLIPTLIHFIIAIFGGLILFGNRKTIKDEIIMILQKDDLKRVELTKPAIIIFKKKLIIFRNERINFNCL